MKLLWIMCLAAAVQAGDWRQWRGPLATGESPDGKPPISWSETENVVWRVPTPGPGHGSPVVSQGIVYLTVAAAVGEAMPPRFSGAPGAHNDLPITHKQRYAVIALNAADGSLRWRRTVASGVPHEGGHETGPLASHSPIVDDERVYAFFGSRGLFCLNLKGVPLWQRDLGTMNTKHGHGEGSTPVLANGVLVVNFDHEGDSFVVAFNAGTGAEIWRQARDEGTSWASPIVVRHGETHQVIVSGTRAIRAYDLATGEVIWSCGGLADNVVASPVHADGVVVAGSSYGKQVMLAIRLAGSKGDVTGTEQVLWKRRRRTPYVPSPLLYRGNVYALNHYQNVISTIDLKSGEDAVPVARLPGISEVYASPVAADGRIYVTDRDGATIVFSAEAEPRILALNRLNDRISASAAIVGDAIYFRGERWIYRIEKTP